MDNTATTTQMRAAPKSGLWQFFTLSQNGQKKIYNCNVCKARFLYTGNTSVLSTHMKTKHPQYVRVIPKNTSNTNSKPVPQTANPIKQEPDTKEKIDKSEKPPGSSSSQKSSTSDPMSASATPTKAKDKERIVKLLHESILHLCKVSVSGPGEIEVDGIVCITQPNDGDIVVKVHETFSNVHNSEKDGESPAPGEKRKAGSHGDSNKTPRKDDSGRDRDRQRTPVSRRLMSDETLDLTGDDDSGRPHRSPNRARSKSSDVIDLTSGRDTPAPQIHISQVRSLGNQPQQRFNGPAQYNQRFGNYRPRGPYQQRPRQRFMGRTAMAPPLRNMGPGQANNVVPIGGPIPHRGFPRAQNMMAQRGPVPGNMQPGNMNMGQQMSANPRGPTDITLGSYKGLRCKYKDCNFSCSNKYYLETHVLQHFNSSAFSCNEEGCDFKTKNKQNLYQHYKITHEAANPQFCLKCIQAFKSPEDLNTHAQSCQVMSIKCDHCGENIQGLVAMAKHLTDVYISESTSSPDPTGSQPGPSPIHTPSTPSPGGASPGVAQSPMQSPSLVPDMSSPLNIIPDITSSQGQGSNPSDIMIQQELEKLEQRLSSDLAPQQQQESQPIPGGTEPQMPGYMSGDDLLQQAISRSSTNSSPQRSPAVSHGTLPFEVQPSSQSQEPITLEVPVQMASDIQLPPGAEAVTLEVIPFGDSSEQQQQQQSMGIDTKPPDITS